MQDYTRPRAVKPQKFNVHRNNSKNKRPYQHQHNTRTRCSAKQQHEKYMLQAREAQSAGDRVLAERYYQYVDHYYRILSQADKKRNKEPADKTTSSLVTDQPVEIQIPEDMLDVCAQEPQKDTKHRPENK